MSHTEPPRPPAPKRTGSSQRMSNRLVALSSAAVVSVYGAGYFRTKAAADRLEAGGQRRPVAPLDVPASATEPVDSPQVDPVATPALTPVATEAVRPAAIDTGVSRREAPAPAPAVAAAAAASTAPKATKAAVVAPVETAPALVPAEVPTLAVPTSVTLQASAPVLQAPAVTLAAPPPPPPPAPKKDLLKDGTYLGWGNCRHGDIQAKVVVTDGRITSATINQCLTRYSCSWIDALPPQVVTRQSPNVDYVSGATQSTDAFYWAVVDALLKAK